MNTLRFELRENLDPDDGRNYFDVHIIVDGVDIIERIVAIQANYKQKAEDDDNDPPFTGLPAEMHYEKLTQQAVGKSKEVALLLCFCRCEGCMDFKVGIMEQGNKVIWTNFYAGMKRVTVGDKWDYSALNGMEFDKKEYWREVEKLKTFFEEGRFWRY